MRTADLDNPWRSRPFYPVLTVNLIAGVLVFETMTRWILQDEASPMPPPSVYMVSKTMRM